MNLKYSECLWAATKNKIYLICQWCNVTPLTCYLTTDSSLALKCIHKPNIIVIIYNLFDYNWKRLFFNKIIESVRATLQRMTTQHLTHFAENDPVCICYILQDKLSLDSCTVFNQNKCLK